MRQSSDDPKRPSVSVIIAVKNGAASIERALSSALAQTMGDLEVLVVDDASQDETPDILRRLSLRDERVRTWRNPVNLGPSGSRNVAIDNARGEWIAPLDADDAFEPQRLATLVALAARHRADMFSDNLLMQPVGRPPYVMIPKSDLAEPRLMTFAAFMQGCFWQKGARRSAYVFMKPLIRRAFVERHGLRYNPRMRNGEDFDLYIRCMMARAVWWISPDANYRYTIETGSMTDRIRVEDRVPLADTLRAALQFARAGGDPTLIRVVKKHWINIRSDVAYIRFKAAVRARDAGSALAVLMRDRYALRDVAVNLCKRSRYSPQVIAYNRRLKREADRFGES